MLTTPPAPPLITGRNFGGNSGRPRGRHAVSLAVTAAAAGGLLAGCASASTHQAGTGSAASGTAGLARCQPSSLQVTVNASQAGGAAAQQNPSFGKVPVKLAAGGVAH